MKSWYAPNDDRDPTSAESLLAHYREQRDILEGLSSSLPECESKEVIDQEIDRLQLLIQALMGAIR